MQVLSIIHRTEYSYREPVRFGEHRLLFRPRDSHDMRLVDSRLKILPASSVRWMHDVFSNSVAVARFDEPAERLLFESVIVVEHYPARAPVFEIDDHARYLPSPMPWTICRISAVPSCVTTPTTVPSRPGPGRSSRARRPRPWICCAG